MSVRVGAMWGMGCGELLGLLGIFKIYRKVITVTAAPGFRCRKKFFEMAERPSIFHRCHTGHELQTNGCSERAERQGELSASGIL